jgi:hypothetical protein
MRTSAGILRWLIVFIFASRILAAQQWDPWRPIASLFDPPKVATSAPSGGKSNSTPAQWNPLGWLFHKPVTAPNDDDYDEVVSPTPIPQIPPEGAGSRSSSDAAVFTPNFEADSHESLDEDDGPLFKPDPGNPGQWQPGAGWNWGTWGQQPAPTPQLPNLLNPLNLPNPFGSRPNNQPPPPPPPRPQGGGGFQGGNGGRPRNQGGNQGGNRGGRGGDRITTTVTQYAGTKTVFDMSTVTIYSGAGLAQTVTETITQISTVVASGAGGRNPLTRTLTKTEYIVSYPTVTVLSTTASYITASPVTPWSTAPAVTSYSTSVLSQPAVTSYLTSLAVTSVITASPVTSYSTVTGSPLTSYSTIIGPAVTSIITPRPITSYLTVTAPAVTSRITGSPLTSYLTTLVQAPPVTLTSISYTTYAVQPTTVYIPGVHSFCLL